MSEVENSIFSVVDNGLFFPVAERLARQAKHVYYHIPNGEAFDTLSNCSRGWGHENITKIDDLFSVKKDVDAFVFPDCGNAFLRGMQVDLEDQGYAVWGSKYVGALETYRGRWHKLCKDLDMPMPETTEIKGITNLRSYLRDHLGCFVKINRFRGDMETWCAQTDAQVENKLDFLTSRWGPLKEQITFYVQEPVDTQIESGSDTYNIWGQFPNEVILGYEKKGESYFAVVKKREDMPEAVWECNERIAHVLKEFKYSNFISSEVRIPEDGKGRWLDPCFRCPSPAGEEQLEMLNNFPQIVLAGAHGELVQPEWDAKYCGEAVISYDGDREGYKSIEVPKDIQRWIKLYACTKLNSEYHFPPSQDHECIGCAVAIGNKPEEVIYGLQELRESLKDQPVTLHIEPMADLINQIEEAEKEGIEFGEDKMPEPEIILESQ